MGTRTTRLQGGCIHIMLNIRCREHISPVVSAEVKVLISENSRVGDTVIYNNGLVICGKRCTWALTVIDSNGRTVKEVAVLLLQQAAS